MTDMVNFLVVVLKVSDFCGSATASISGVPSPLVHFGHSKNLPLIPFALTIDLVRRNVVLSFFLLGILTIRCVKSKYEKGTLSDYSVNMLIQSWERVGSALMLYSDTEAERVIS